MEILRTLEKQHHEVDVLFERFRKNRDISKRQRILTTLVNNLTAHMAAEEEVLYPMVRKLESQGLKDGLKEHNDIRRMLEPVTSAMRTMALVKMDSLVTDLRRCVTRHVTEEEFELFPALRIAMSEDDRVELNEKYVRVFEMHLQGAVMPFQNVPRMLPTTILRATQSKFF